MWAEMHTIRNRRVLCIAAAFTLLFAVRPPMHASDPHRSQSQKPAQDWPVYDGQRADDHYSPLTQINRAVNREL